MSLAAPWGLLGLLGLPVILALHMMRLRQRSYRVSSLALWNFLEPEVHGSRFRRVPFTWLLLSDLLLAAILSLALAKPNINIVLPVKNARQVILLMDVSNSMRATDVLPDRFSKARLEALGVLNSVGPRDVATLISFGNGAHWIGDTRQNAFQEVVTRLTNLKAGEIGNALIEGLAQGQSLSDGKLPIEFHIFTDAAYEQPSLQEFPHPIVWHIAANGSNNQAVISVTSQRQSGDKYQVFARIANYSQEPANSMITLLEDGEPSDSTPIVLPANSEMTQVWMVEGNPSAISVSLLNGDDLKEDDSASIGLPTRQPIHVLLVISEPTRPDSPSSMSPIERALSSIIDLEVRKLTPDEYFPSMDADLVIFLGRLPAEWPGKPTLILQPQMANTASDGPVFDLKNSMDLPAGDPLVGELEDPLLSGVDFSGVRWGSAAQLGNLPAGFTPILGMGDIPLILRGSIAGYSTLAMLFDLQSGNLANHPAFPLMIVNLIEHLRAPQVSASIITGQAIILPPKGDLQSLQILPPEGSAVVYSNEWPTEWEQTLDPGLYRIVTENKDGKAFESSIGINAGDSAESNIVSHPVSGNSAANSQASPVEAAQNINLGPWLLGVAVLLFILEAFLAWR